jgi:hypothetical protein
MVKTLTGMLPVAFRTLQPRGLPIVVKNKRSPAEAGSVNAPFCMGRSAIRRFTP